MYRHRRLSRNVSVQSEVLESRLLLTGLTLAENTLLTQANVGNSVDTAETGDRFGSTLARGDFDDDGFLDLAVGVPGEDHNVEDDDRGRVYIIYGTADGLNDSEGSANVQVLSAPSGSVNDKDEFGAALAVGDFDNDGHDDLAVAAPSDTIDNDDEPGTVFVFFGNSTGGRLSFTPTLELNAESGLHANLTEGNTGDGFGMALTAGDLNNDDVDDLAIGIPFLEFTAEDDAVTADAGATLVLYGAANDQNGLAEEEEVLGPDNEVITIANNLLVAPVPTAEGRFGETLAVGKLDADDIQDLVVGAPNAVLGAGRVHLVAGSELTGVAESAYITLSSGAADSDFGRSFAVGDFDLDGSEDLAVGEPGHQQNRGRVAVYDGPILSASQARELWSQSTSGIEGVREVDDFFGYALAAGDFSGDGVDDLAIGVPGENLDGTSQNSIVDAGAVNVIYGDNGGGLDSDESQFLHQDIFEEATNDAPFMQGVAGDNDQFGASLVAGDYCFPGSAGRCADATGDGDNRIVDGVFDLIVGVPLDDDRDTVRDIDLETPEDDTNDFGSVAVIYGELPEGGGSGGIPNVAFETSAVVVAEGGDFSLNVVRGGDTSESFEVTYTVQSGTANRGTDYILDDGTLTFGPGVTSLTIDYTTIDDTFPENDETFEVVLSDPTNDAVLGEPTRTEVTILDDDIDPVSVISFASGLTSVPEQGSYELTVNRDGDLTGTVVVSFAVSGAGDADLGTDFELTSGTLTFGPGVPRGVISFTILEDTLIEGDEVFEVILSNPGGGATIGALPATVVSIIDDDIPAELSFANSVRVVGESGTYELDVNRDGDSSTSVTVDYSVVAGGSATNGVDYELTAGTLTFDAGDDRESIEFEVMEDLLVEGDETFEVVLSNPSAEATIGSPSSIEVTISDDDFPSVAIWNNRDNPFDVNGDGEVAPNDVLRIVREVNNPSVSDPFTQRLSNTFSDPPGFIDVNGDGFVTAIDALQLIQFLNDSVAGANAQAEPAEAGSGWACLADCVFAASQDDDE